MYFIASPHYHRSLSGLFKFTLRRSCQNVKLRILETRNTTHRLKSSLFQITAVYKHAFLEKLCQFYLTNSLLIWIILKSRLLETNGRFLERFLIPRMAAVGAASAFLVAKSSGIRGHTSTRNIGKYYGVEQTVAGGVYKCLIVENGISYVSFAESQDEAYRMTIHKVIEGVAKAHQRRADIKSGKIDPAKVNLVKPPVVNGIVPAIEKFCTELKETPPMESAPPRTVQTRLANKANVVLTLDFKTYSKNRRTYLGRSKKLQKRKKAS